MTIFGNSKIKDQAHSLYVEIVNQARQPFLFKRFGVPDTVDGRFDMISLHVFLVLKRLKGEGKELESLSQCLFDTMFADMDRSLREMGVGDLGVGKRVKAMIKAFYGRLSAYEKAMSDQDPNSLSKAILRNVFRGDMESIEGAEKITSYINVFYSKLLKLSAETLINGKLPVLDEIENVSLR
tara:strand:- start:586 stop:1131 length:546 start_codon:yes stop_codon:yes gene_type:complete